MCAGSEKPRRVMAEYLECGKIINIHGLDGTVKLESWCDTPDVLASLKCLYFSDLNGGYTPKKVVKASVQKKFVLARLEGVNTPEAAEALRGAVVWAARDELPLDPGAHFIADLIGLPVIDADSGREYGTLSYVFNAGASDIYTVDTPDGERMMPAVPEFVISVDIEKGIYIRPIEGMFD